MTAHACTFCSWEGHLGERSPKACPVCGSGVAPLTAAMKMARKAKAVELQRAFMKACEVPADQDWSADRHCKREGADA